MTLFHIITAEAWAEAEALGTYAPPSLSSEGFIHLSTAEQVPGTLARFYAGVPDLLLLSVEVSDAVFEEVGHGTFPHLYRPLATTEVVAVRPARDPRR